MPLLYCRVRVVEIAASEAVIARTHRTDSDARAEDGLGLVSNESSGYDINTQQKSLVV